MTNEYADNGVTFAATEVIDGVTYQIIELTSDNNQNKNIINAHENDTTGNYHYKLTADWYTNGVWEFLYGARIIFDLNGHTLTIRQMGDYEGIHRGVVCFHATISAEIADFSPAGTGTIINGSGIYSGTFAFYDTPTVIISGGRCANTAFITQKDVVVRGGNYQGYGDGRHSPFVYHDTMSSLTFAPYMFVNKNSAGVALSFRPYDEYAVSTTPYASGAYNYEYGLVWELSLAELQKQTIPTDKTYYLWARNQDGAYQYLNAYYCDGTLKSAIQARGTAVS